MENGGGVFHVTVVTPAQPGQEGARRGTPDSIDLKRHTKQPTNPRVFSCPADQHDLAKKPHMSTHANHRTHNATPSAAWRVARGAWRARGGGGGGGDAALAALPQWHWWLWWRSSAALEALGPQRVATQRPSGRCCARNISDISALQ